MTDLQDYIDKSEVNGKLFYICEIHRNVTVYVAKSEDGEVDISWERQPNTTDEIVEAVDDFHYERGTLN